MPGPLDALERIMEDAIEGSIQRLFRPRLQPIQIAKAAARQMDRQQVVGPAGPEVPNSYTISLHPEDFERFARYQAALQRELEKYLAKYARDRHWRPVSALSVVLQADPAARVGRPRVVAQMLDVRPSRTSDQAQPAAAEEPIQRTTQQPRVVAAPAVESRETGSYAHLEGDNGEQFALDRPVTRLGRALDNDVVLQLPEVSRFHAEIERQEARYLLRDLDSTNGTLVADQPIDEQELRDGDVISLGGFRLVFRES